MPAFTLNDRQTVVKKTRKSAQPAAPLPPEKRTKKPVEMAEKTFVGSFRLAMNDAEEYIDGHIAPLRATATRMYRGEPFGNEEHGRSQIVMTETRDAVLAILPSLMRIFVSGETVVEFIPASGEYIDQAEQQTATVNHVFMNDNPGFTNLYSTFKDALVRKIGVIKWRWADDTTVSETQYTGIAAEQVALLQNDQKTARLKGTPDAFRIMGDIEESDRPEADEGAPPTYDVKIRRVVPKNRIVIECLPPEEFLIARDARDVETASFVAHRSYKTVSDLVAMGYKRETIVENMGGGDMFAMNFEAQARNPAVLTFMTSFDNPDDTMRRVLTVEGYMRIDKDGDGIAELRKITAIGDAYHILDDEMVDEAPFAIFCPDPEPHMVIGQSVADQTMDLQLISSNMMRAMLDSLAGSIHPRTVVVEGRVNLDDAMNTEQGAIIRTKDISAVNELVKPFVGQSALPVMAYVAQIKSKRTGITDASAGLDPQMLQSATHSAVAATVTGAQERIELYARIFAETGMTRVCRGVAKMLRENQDQARVIKLHGSWVPVDPRSWIGDLACQPNVALGKGTDQDKIAFLGMVAQKQELIIQTLGPTNQLAGIDKYAKTLKKIVTLAGFKDSSTFFGEVTPDYMAQLAKAASNPPPNPQMMLVQVEAKKNDDAHQVALLKLQQTAQQDHAKNELERDKVHINALTKMAELDAAHGREVHTHKIDTVVDHGRQTAQMHLDHAAAIHDRHLSAATDHHATQTQAGVDRHNNELQAEVAERNGQRQAEAAKAAAKAAPLGKKAK